MCGIAGYLGTRRLAPETMNACLARMRHRGPDGSGVYCHDLPDGRRCHLLHARLAIIDPDERSNQPMRFGSHVFVYNGELYDYREVRAREGWRDLATEGDTEVLLRLLAERGWPALDEAEGMWAFALLDERDGSLLLGRDRFGEKPLHLLETPDGIYFASEIKLLRILLGRDLAVDHEHLKRYLVNGYRALFKQRGRASFFRDVRELRPGTVLRLDGAGRRTEHRYWTPSSARDESMDFETAAALARDAVRRAVEIRLRADVPIAFLMSGGVDSNALISIARREFGQEVHGFTIMNADARYDEQDLVEHCVGALGIRHHPVTLDTADFLENLRGLVEQHDAPVCTISFYAHWMLVRAVAGHGYKIVISGTGADELFTGYYDHHNAYLHAVRHDPERLAEARADWERWLGPIVRNPYLARPDLFIEEPDCREHLFLDAEQFAANLREPWAEPFAETRYCPGLLRNRMLNELFHESIPPMLHDEDLNAMSVSIENRTPFLDRALFDVCARMPDRLLVRDGYAKAVLRASMRGIVPDRVLDERRKVGFNAPIHDLLDHRCPRTREAVLAPGPVYDLVRRDAIERLLEEDELPNSRSKFLFYFLNARAFLDEFAA